MSEKVLANWNGQEMPLSDVRVSVLDRAFLFGDAVYEVARVYNGRLFRFDDHMDRLTSSLAKMNIKFVEVEEVRQRIHQTVKNSGVLDGLVYLQITRGEAPRKHRYPDTYKPNVLIYVDHLSDPFAKFRSSGIDIVTHPDIRWGHNDIKQTGLTGNCMVAQYAYERGCLEAILIDADGFMTEGTHSTIFGIKDGTIIAAPESPKVLPGITKKQVFELARDNGIPLIEKWIKGEEIHSLDEIFLAGTGAELVAIVKVDGRVIGSGAPGPVFTRLQEAFKNVVSEWLSMSGAKS